MDRAEIERRVVARIRDVAWTSPHHAREEHRLLDDFLLSGEELCRLGDLLEAEFAIDLTPADLLGVALMDPTVGGLCHLVAEQVLRDA